MPNISRKGDMTSGHGCFPPQTIEAGSPNVNANGRPVARDGDAVSKHTCVASSHGSTVKASGGTVFVNGKTPATVGCDVACGSIVITGSSNVNVG